MASVGRQPKGDRAKKIANTDIPAPNDAAPTTHINNTVSCAHPVPDVAQPIPGTVSSPKRT